ncbi:hypothetical protein G6F43_000256 [Rhizopus delemar]|nr:hypothetical protein G6F43_000256 [Rhizopus delemar]
MSTSSAQFYSANVSDFETMNVDKAIWEVELKKLEDSTCVHWTNKGFKIKEIVSSNATESSSVGRNKTILWTSGNHRPIQKESKKIGCPACIMVTCYRSDPEFVIFERKSTHNHVPRSYVDLKFISLSDALRRKIKAFLQYEFSRREIRSCLLQEIDEDAEERDELLHYDDVHNIWLSVAKDMFKFKENEFESLKVWEEKLTATNYKVLSYSMENTFYYGIISS